MNKSDLIAALSEKEDLTEVDAVMTSGKAGGL